MSSPVTVKILYLSTGHVPRAVARVMDIFVEHALPDEQLRRDELAAFLKTEPGSPAFENAYRCLSTYTKPSPYGDTGWLMFAEGLTTELPEELAMLRPIGEVARSTESFFVLFDADEPPTEELPQYDW